MSAVRSIALSLALLAAPTLVHARPTETRIVQLAPGALPASFAGRWERLFPGHERAGDPLATFFRWMPPDGQTLAAAGAELLTEPAVVSVEADRVVPLASCTPSDPYFAHAAPDSAQWPLNANPLGPDVRALDAWNVTTGNPDVPLAILDSGTDWHHPEFGPPLSSAGRIWFNPTEVGGAPGVDDDGNGFIDDVRGWDFVDVSTIPGEVNRVDPAEDGLMADNDPVDYDGHGTFVSGIAGAAMDDGVGMAGVAPGVRLMPLRVGWREDYIDPGNGRHITQGVVSMSFCAQAIVYAADNGARVLNCSWLSDETPEMVAALNYAIGVKGVVVVDAAGNGGLTSSQSRNYLSRRGDCIEVAALAQSGEVSGVTSIGGWVDISAPGEKLLSLVKTGVSRLYRINDAGATSFAAPFVSATAALIRSVSPGMTPAEVRAHLMATATDIYGIGVNSNALYLGKLGAGMVNAGAALEALRPAVRATLTAPLDPPPLVLDDGTFVGVDAERFVVAWAEGAPERFRLPGDGAVVGQASTRDGTVRIDVVTLTNGRVAVLADGQFAPGWPRPTGGLLFGDPVILSYGVTEIAVAGSDSLMYLWSLDGRSRAGFPARLPDAVLTSPASGNLDLDDAPELVVVTADDRVSIVDADGGVHLWSDTNPAPLVGASHAPPILADVTGDGRLDVVLTGTDRIAVLPNPGGANPGVAWISEPFGGLVPAGETIAADLENDGRFEIIGTFRSGSATIWRYSAPNDPQPPPAQVIDLGMTPAGSVLTVLVRGELWLLAVSEEGCFDAFLSGGARIQEAHRWLSGSTGRMVTTTSRLVRSPTATQDPAPSGAIVELADGSLRYLFLGEGTPLTFPQTWGMVGGDQRRSRSLVPKLFPAPIGPAHPDRALAPITLTITPNPARAGTPIRFERPERVLAGLVIHDVLGRVVRRFDGAENDNRSGVLVWDGRSDVGRPVAAGLYLARARFDDGTSASARFVVVR